MSSELTAELNKCLKGRICFVGLGNEDLGDDAFGIKLAEALRSFERSDVVIAGTDPEKFTGSIAGTRPDTVVLLDAVEISGEPGSLVFMDATQVKSRYPQISTHRISLGTLATWIETQTGAKVRLIGMKPASLRPGAGLSEAVKNGIKNIVEILKIVLIQDMDIQIRMEGTT